MSMNSPKYQTGGKHIPSISSSNTYYNQADSDDDDNNFQPPVLSNYALTLLQKEQNQTRNMGITSSSKSLPKRVNFINSPKNKPTSKSHNENLGTNFIEHDSDSKTNSTHRHDINNHTNNQNSTNNNTAHTNQSEYETIFTKDVNGEFDSYGSLSPNIANDKNQRTPLNIINVTASSAFNSGSIVRNRSIRRAKTLGSLGPPKRASYVPQTDLHIRADDINDNKQEGTEVGDTPMKDAISPKALEVSIPFHEKVREINTPTKSHDNQVGFDFEGLNPYQYSRKYQLSPSDLPKLVKIYFEQQRKESKQSLNSPLKLKEVLRNKVEEDLRAEAKSQPFSNASRKPSRSSKSPLEQERILVYSDKENFSRDRASLQGQSPVSFKRSSKRRPLLPLDDANVQNTQKSQSEKELYNKQTKYHEHHYKKVEPLKEPDYTSAKSTSRLLTINGKQYEKLELLGKGGSSKVFKVKSLSNKVYAIKKISFDEFDDYSIKGFKGEIDLLTKLKDKDRVVKLIDHCLNQGSLMLVMECGEIDLFHVLAKRIDLPLDVEFVRFHSNEVLKCVKAVHDAGIVHSDLKPANFLFVKGILKIIDFGIANAVPDHTVNIYRESQIGTPNYMAPEALMENNLNSSLSLQNHNNNIQKTTWRVGKPSDIWSCGCIIFQMIYGRPPYGGYQGSQRLLAIMNPEVKVIYPEKGLGGIKVPGTAIATIQACLMRDPSKRWNAQELLDGPFLKPRVVSEQFVNDLVKNAITYGVNKSSVEDDELKTLADDVWRRVSNLSL